MTAAVPSVLARICADKLGHIARVKATKPLAALIKEAEAAPAPKGFAAALSSAVARGGIGLIAEIKPEDAGVVRGKPEGLKGSDAASNAAAVRALLKGERGPFRDVVVLNAGAALVVAGKATDLAKGAAMAAASLDSGKAAKALDRMVAITNAKAAA